MEIITKESEFAKEFFATIDRIRITVEHLAKNSRPIFGGERYITDSELSERLHLSRRTLQDYRSSGTLPYFKLGGKVLYKESDVEKLLRDNYYRIVAPVLHQNK
jgi:excisionase family DNA binding protein